MIPESQRRAWLLWPPPRLQQGWLSICSLHFPERACRAGSGKDSKDWIKKKKKANKQEIRNQPQMVQVTNNFQCNFLELLRFLKKIRLPEKTWLSNRGISSTNALGRKSFLGGKEASPCLLHHMTGLCP